VIGVYEPFVLVSDGRARTTSLAAEPDAGQEPGERFHRGCHRQSAGAVAPAP
jgi:hypothetical protein